MIMARLHESSPEPRIGERHSVECDIPWVGSINEPRLLSEGWRVVRDPSTGMALYKEYVGGVAA